MNNCPDCQGPLVQAFDTTVDYVRCRRCGHVFTSDKVQGKPQTDR